MQPINNGPIFKVSGMAGRITSGDNGHILVQVIALACFDIDAVDSSDQLEGVNLRQLYRARIIGCSLYDFRGWAWVKFFTLVF